MSAPLHVVTPLVESRALSTALGEPVLLKLEALQPCASFKIRGLGATAAAAAAQGARRLVSSSGGNAGLAVAYAGRRLGLAVTVVVPRTTSEKMRALIRREGAEVLEHGAVWDEAHARALELAAAPDAALVHPFDDPRIWAGHATLVEELAQQGPKPGVVVLSVGGGGLACGVLEGLHRVGWRDVPVLAVETRGADSFARSVAAGELVTLASIDSIATSLGARRVASRLMRWTREHALESHVVSDCAAVEACARFADDHRLLVEPACGAALAPVYARADAVRGRGPVVVVVCGGAGVDLDLLARWR